MLYRRFYIQIVFFDYIKLVISNTEYFQNLQSLKKWWFNIVLNNYNMKNIEHCSKFHSIK